MYPLKIGSSEQFQELRALLREAGYTEEAVCARVGIPAIYEFKTLREGRPGDGGITDGLDVLIRLLMDEEAVPLATIEQHLGAGAAEAMAALGITKPLASDPSRVWADAVLFPQEGLFIAADRTFLVEKMPGTTLPDDVVYASITKNTGRFISILPGDRCEKFLELCAGTGVAALIAGARYAERSWACDLSGRCTHLAEFNARLNGIANMQALAGDLYAPVEGEQFDRIVAHPPYIPAEEQKLMFRDGGEDGEQILRGIVQGLPRFLKPGGRFYALTLATDREGENVEQRVRKWIGETEKQFDVLLVYNDAEQRPNAILKAVAEAKGKLGELGPRSKLYERLKVETILYGVIVIERHAEAREGFTARTKKSRRAGSEAVEWFREWQRAAIRPEFAEMLARSRPKPAAGLLLLVTHAATKGQLAPVEFRARSEQPLESDARIEPWVAELVGACDGQQSVRELFGYLKKREVITDGMQPGEFLEVIRVLIESGFLEIAEFALPAGRPRARASSASLVQ